MTETLLVFPENYTEIEKEVARIGFKQGLTWAKHIKEGLENGTIDPNKSIRLIGEIGVNTAENFPRLTNFYAMLGSPEVGTVSNAVIAGVGVYTGGNSAIQFGLTTNRQAKFFYTLSILCSGTAIASAGTAVAARTCQISGTAALSESFGIAFMKLGNRAHVAALQLEGKPIPQHLQTYMNKNIRPRSYDPGGLGFIMPNGFSSEFIAQIPFATIGKTVGLTIAIYGYGKIIISGYRYTQQWVAKIKKQRQTKLIREQSLFLLIAVNRLPSLRQKKSPNFVAYSSMSLFRA